MDKTKQLYKVGPRAHPTLSARVKDKNSRRKTARLDKFAAGRKIPLDNSPGTPERQPVQLISKIADRVQKLKAFRLQRNTQKFKEIQEQKSPFILTVPIGRWVEKKDRAPQFRVELNDTPVRKALMSERVLKKSTVKELIAQSTAKKENVMMFGKNAPKPVAVKSKKRILGEFNTVQTVASACDESGLAPLLEQNLNSTFEITPEQNEREEIHPRQRLRRSNSMPDIAPKTKTNGRKMLTPPVKAAVKKYPINKSKPVKPRIAHKTPVPVKAVAPAKAIVPVKRSEKKPLIAKQLLTAKPAVDEIVEVTQEQAVVVEEHVMGVKAVQRPAKKKQSVRSATYNLYKSSLDIYVSYLTVQISEIMKNKEMFIDVLSEDQQTFVHQTIQQGNLLISDKLGKFQEFLDKFEAALSQPDNPKSVTADDVENYWYLIYEEIEKLKADLIKTQELKKGALAEVASQRKRLTRKTFFSEGTTPRRSQRIAEVGGTPKHNASCYGCVTMSASKLNTPKSAHKRRTVKKSVLFESPLVTETPKRSEGRRVSKRNVLTPKRSLLRMNAVDIDEHDLELADISKLV